MSANDQPPRRIHRPASSNLAISVGFLRAPNYNGVPYEPSDDSYLDELEDYGHILYREMIEEIASLDGTSSLVEQRRLISRNAKGMDEASKAGGWWPEKRSDL